ncbi:MAG: glycosyltransferase [Kineosporiaceae bacterium]
MFLAHPSAELYGSDRMALQSALALRAEGEVTVVVPREGPFTQACREHGLEVVIADVPVLRRMYATPVGILRLGLRTLRALPRLVRLLRQSRADVVYVNTLTIPIWLAAARLARVPALCHVHEAEPDVGRAVGWALSVPARLARSVVVNSRAAYAALVRALPSIASRTSVIYNGIEEPPSPLPGPSDPLDKPVRLLLVGRISARKGTDLAVDALARLVADGVDARLDLAGDVFEGYEWFEAQVRETVEREGLAERVRFLGFVDDVWSSHAEADVVLMPSRAEPFGNAAVEAMLAGRPLVAAAVQGLPEIVTHGRTGVLVAADDARALADGVRLLVDDWSQAMRIARAGREEAERRFSMEAYRSSVRAAVRAIARGGSPAREVAPAPRA